MTEDFPGFRWNDAEKDLMAGIDTSVPHSARVWNYLLGGKDHYPADKEAADCCAEFFPGLGDLARACRYFAARVVSYLAGQAGIGQFLDIGAGLPGPDSTHAIAQRAAPACRVVYADNDPLVMAHARALLTCGPPGSTGYLDANQADLATPAALTDAACDLLDFTRPVAILLINVLGHIGDPSQDGDQAARSAVDQLKAALPPGGYLALCDGTSTSPAYRAAMDDYNQTGAAPYHLRSPGQLSRILDGLQPVPPGVVPVHRWRPDHSPFPRTPVPAWGAVAKKTSTVPATTSTQGGSGAANRR